MNYKKQTYIVLLSILIFIGMLEAVYSETKLYRHELDFQIEKLSKIENKNYAKLLLSDSITRTPLWNIKLNKDVLNLTTSAAISCAGNYLLLKRFLESENKVTEVYFFVSHVLLIDDLKSPFVYSHFESVFTHRNEKSVMKKEGYSHLYQRNDYFHKRFNALLKVWGIKEDNKRIYTKNVFIDNPKILYLDKSNSQRNKNAIKHFTKRKLELSKTSNIFLKKLQKLCLKNNIKLKYIIEPMPNSVHRHFLNSNLYKDFIQIVGGNIIDINKIHIFEDVAFYDGEHLKDGWKNIYNQIIQSNVSDIFPAIRNVKLLVNKIENNSVISMEEGTIYSGDKDKNGNYHNICVNFKIDIKREGKYRLYVKVLAKDHYSNSFFITSKHHKKEIFHLPLNTMMSWSKKSFPLLFDKGENDLLLCNREDIVIREIRIKPFYKR